MRGTWQTTDGGGGGGLALAVIAVIVIGSAASAIARALELVLIVTGCTAAAAAILGITYVIWQARQDRQERPAAAPVVYQVAPEVRPHLEETGKPAIGPGREVHLHLNVSPDQLTAIVRHYTEEDR